MVKDICIPRFGRLLALIFILIGVLLSGCERGGTALDGSLKNLSDLNSSNYTIGSMTGIVALTEGKKSFPKAQFKEYSMPIDAFTALCSGKIDAVILDRPTLEFLSLAHPELTVMDENLAPGNISVATAKDRGELMMKINGFIRQMRNDGTYQQMLNRWFRQKDSKMPEIGQGEPLDDELKVGVTANNEPLCFVQDKKLAGYDAEFSLRLGEYLGKRVKFIDMPYDALVAGLKSGKIDVAVAYMDAMPEREDSVLFSNYYIDAPITVVVHSRLCAVKSPEKILKPKDLNYTNKVIAGETGTLSLREAKKSLPKAKFIEFSNPIDCYTALGAGKANAVIYDRPPMEYASLDRPEFVVLPDDIAVGHISIASAKGRQELMNRVNVFIRKYRADGTYQRMYDRWVRSKIFDMPSIGKPQKPTGTIKIGITADNPPMCSFREREYVGFDIEFAKRFALFANVKLEFVNMSFDALIPAINSGKIDLAIAQMDATPERCESVLFSEEYINSPISLMVRRQDYGGSDIMTFQDLKGKRIGDLTGSAYESLAKPYLPEHTTLSFSQQDQVVAALQDGEIDALYTNATVGHSLLLQHPELMAMEQQIPCGNDASILILVRREGTNTGTPGLWQWCKDAAKSLADSFNKTFIRENRWQLILQGLGTTLVITVFSVLFGTLLAFPVCMMCRSKRKPVAWLGAKYVSLIMGTPILVILMILYYVIFAKVDINAIVVAVIAFAMDFAAYASVMLRSGIEAIPQGQTEAALALGHTPAAAFLRFVLPQAIRSVLPVYRSEIISTLKSTSIVGYIAIMDLTKMGDIIRSRTYEAFFPLIAIAVIYFMAAKGLTAILIFAERQLDPDCHRNKLKERGAK